MISMEYYLTEYMYVYALLQPLPFSEESDAQIQCIMAMGPDLITFVDANITVRFKCVLLLRVHLLACIG